MPDLFPRPRLRLKESLGAFKGFKVEVPLMGWRWQIPTQEVPEAFGPVPRYGPPSLQSARLNAAFGAREAQAWAWEGILPGKISIAFCDKADFLESINPSLASSELTPESIQAFEAHQREIESWSCYRCYHLSRYHIDYPDGRENRQLPPYHPSPPYRQEEIALTVTLQNEEIHIQILSDGFKPQPVSALPENWLGLMARGLYKMGEDAMLAELERKFGPQLSMHDKLACREEMPRELWPQRWKSTSPGSLPI